MPAKPLSGLIRWRATMLLKHSRLSASLLVKRLKLLGLNHNFPLPWTLCSGVCQELLFILDHDSTNLPSCHNIYTQQVCSVFFWVSIGILYNTLDQQTYMDGNKECTFGPCKSSSQLMDAGHILWVTHTNTASQHMVLVNWNGQEQNNFKIPEHFSSGSPPWIHIMGRSVMLRLGTAYPGICQSWGWWLEVQHLQMQGKSKGQPWTWMMETTFSPLRESSWGRAAVYSLQATSPSPTHLLLLPLTTTLSGHDWCPWGMPWVGCIVTVVIRWVIR